MAGALIAEDVTAGTAVVLTTQHGELPLAAPALADLFIGRPHHRTSHHVCLQHMMMILINAQHSHTGCAAISSSSKSLPDNDVTSNRKKYSSHK